MTSAFADESADPAWSPDARQIAVDTGSLRRAFADALGEEQVGANVTRKEQGSPLGRLTQTPDIAHAVALLSSYPGSGVTGIELFVDAGITQMG